MFEVLFLAVVLIYALVMSYQDIRFRKIKNNLTYSLLLLSSLLFIYSQFVVFSIVNIITLAMMVLVSFYVFHKKILGAADGKIIIGISMILLSLNVLYLFDFIINTIILYVFTLLMLIITKTSLSSKITTFREQNYLLICFQTLLTLSILALFSRFIGFDQFDIMFTLTLFLIVLITIAPLGKKLFKKLDENSQIVISFILFCYAFYDLFSLFLTSFIYLFTIKSLIQIIPNLSEKIQYKRGHTSFPLIPVLFLSLIVVILLQKNLVLVLFGY